MSFAIMKSSQTPGTFSADRRRPRSFGCHANRCVFSDQPKDQALDATACGRAALSHFLIVTNVTVFTKLFARTNLPSRVTEVLRTILPPPGIGQLWNFAVFGSKRTIVFGVAFDSLYQMTSLIAEMP
jgi:hypothetical protein